MSILKNGGGGWFSPPKEPAGEPAFSVKTDAEAFVDAYRAESQRPATITTTYQIQQYFEEVTFLGPTVLKDFWVDLTAPDTWDRTLRVYQLMEKGERKLRIIERHVEVTEWDDIVPESDYV